MNAYEMNERRIFHADIQRIESAPLVERQASRSNLLADMQTDPALIAERVAWLLNGSYGKGSYDAAREVAANKRMNRPAYMVQIIGTLEWGCPGAWVRENWNKLNKAQQKALNDAVNAEIEYHLEDANAEA